MGNPECCAVVRGTTILKIAVLPIATTTRTTTTTTAFGLCVVSPPSALLCQSRCMGMYRACLYKSPDLFPVMLVTVSENQTGLGSLVGNYRKVTQFFQKILSPVRFFKSN